MKISARPIYLPRKFHPCVAEFMARSAEAAHGTAKERSPHGFERDVVGFRNRRFMERFTGRRVWTVACGRSTGAIITGASKDSGSG
jgi:hypothetical protein